MKLNPQIKQIKENFNKVIQYSQGIENPKTDLLFATWLDCKRDFIEAFGNELIYEYPKKVSFELGEKEKHDRVIAFANMIADKWGYSDLANFIETQELGFFKNLTIEDYTGFNGKIIKKGTKLVKAFKYFITNERSLTDIQNEASRIIQEDKIEGTLCLSVHPLDFLSLSENTYNWRSCHALDGEYRAGNLSYMMDKSTVICYLKADNDIKLPSFPEDVPWNSKKWRVLLYFSNSWNMIFAGRQYPFEASTGLNFVLEQLLPAAHLKSKYDWTGWNSCIDTEITLANNIRVNLYNPYVVIGQKLIPLESIVLDGNGSKQFNDILHSSCYKPVYAVKYTENFWSLPQLTTNDFTQFIIGGYTYCLLCGEKETLTGSDTIFCEECELKYGTTNNDMFTYCECCGCRMYVEDAYVVDDHDVCPGCYEKHCARCENCEANVYNDEIFYDEETEQYLCYDCYQELKESRKNGS